MTNSGLWVRNTHESDIPRLCEIEKAAWEREVPRALLFTEEHFQSHLQVFPEGQFVALMGDDIVAYLTLERLKADPQHLAGVVTSWLETTGNGFLTTHNPEGNVLYGVSMGAVPHHLGAGAHLINRGVELMIELGCQCGFLVGRMPGYHKYASSMNPEEYLYATSLDGTPLDPQVRLYVREGLRIGGLVSNYMEDPKSHNYGVLLVIDNPEL